MYRTHLPYSLYSIIRETCTAINLSQVLKKYRAAVQQVSAEQAQLQEAQVQIAALEAEKSSLKDQLSELTQRLESVEQLGDPTANSLATRRLEFRAKELESKLELEQTTRARLEVSDIFLCFNSPAMKKTTCLYLGKKKYNLMPCSSYSVADSDSKVKGES